MKVKGLKECKTWDDWRGLSKKKMTPEEFALMKRSRMLISPELLKDTEYFRKLLAESFRETIQAEIDNQKNLHFDELREVNQ